MNAAAEPVRRELTLEPPETIRYGSGTFRLGGTVYRAVECVLSAKRRAVTVRQLCVAVWGRTVGPEVSIGTVKGVVHRANDVLAGIGSPERLSIDKDNVLLV